MLRTHKIKHLSDDSAAGSGAVSEQDKSFYMVVENVLGITIPERACYLRVVAEEIKRKIGRASCRERVYNFV